MFKLIKLIFAPIMWVLRLVGIGGSLPVDVEVEAPGALDSVVDVVAEPAGEPVTSQAPPNSQQGVQAEQKAAKARPSTGGKSGSPFRVGKTDFDVRVSKMGRAIADATGLPGEACSVGARVIHDFISQRLMATGEFTLVRVGAFKLDRRNKRIRFKSSPVLRRWIHQANMRTPWPHAMSTEEEHRIRYWEPAARNGLGEAATTKSVDGLSVRRHLAWALHQEAQMPLKWTVLMVRGWEQAMVGTLLNKGRLQAKGLGFFKVHRVDGKSDGINGPIGAYAYVSFSPAQTLRQAV